MNDTYTFDDYQKQSKKTALYPTIGQHRVLYPTLGIADEAGEVVGKIKKVFRDKQGIFVDEDITEIKKELGDVLWYLTQIATDLGIELKDVAKANIEKLYSRYDRGVLGGSGDNR